MSIERFGLKAWPHLLVYLCCGVAAFMFPVRLGAEILKPEAALQTFLETVRSMEFPVTDHLAHERLIRKANAYLDLETMGKDALGGHWAQATNEERNTFLDLMWQQIELVAYPQSREFLGDYEITYPEVRHLGNGFEIQSVVKQQEAALDASVVYHLYEQDAQWKIDDIVLDDVSIIEDLSYQFEKIINDSSFGGLLERMREKLRGVQEKRTGEAA